MRVEQGAIFRQALHINFRYLLLISFLGLSSASAIAGLVGLRGFPGVHGGFSGGANAARRSVCCRAILPHNLILIPR